MQLAADNFNRANGGLGTNWTTVSGQSAPSILSNAAVTSAVGGTASRALYSGINWPNDQYCEFTLGALLTNDDFIGCMVRNSATTTACYVVVLQGPAGGGATQIALYVEDAFQDETTLANAGIVSNIGDVFRLSAVGTAISVYQNGSLVMSATDSTLASGSPGIAIYVSSGSAGDCALDNWDGGNFVTFLPPIPDAQAIIIQTRDYLY